MKCIIVIFIIFLSFRLEASFQDIPEKEVKEIKFLFEYLINRHDFAYTIYGSKPMSLADLCLWIPDIPDYKKFQSYLFLMKIKQSLDAWNSHKHLINRNEFILLDKEEDLFQCLVFVLIHKPHMIALLNSNKEIFKQVLGDSFDPLLFLEKIEKREISLAKSINHHQGLLGIMLGYGLRNSMLFQEKLVIIKEIEKRKGVLNTESELYKKYQKVCSQLQPFNEFEDFSIVMPLHFGADITHPETIELRKRYESDQRKIVELMRQSNFMDKVMNRLIE